MATDPGDLVLDPTCGSGTTASVAEQWGRRWITIDTSRVALALARARIMGAAIRITCWLIPAKANQGSGNHPHRTSLLNRCTATSATASSTTRAAHHAQIDRQQRRDRRHLGQMAAKLEPLRESLNPRSRRSGRNGRFRAKPMPSGRTRRRNCTPTGGRPASPGRRRSTPPSPPRPSSNTSTTSPTRTRRRSAWPGRSRSRACRPTACWASMRTTN